MEQLSLSCLGSLQVTLAGQPVDGFKSNKVRALLVYLAIEADRPHRRDLLAGLLWPDWPDRDALSNVRYALANLRKVIADQAASPSYLMISRDSLQFNTKSDHWIDVRIFLDQTELGSNFAQQETDLSVLEEAVDLYQGCFLEGFSIKDSSAFEDWILLKRRQIDQRLLTILRYLVHAREGAGQYELAKGWANKQLALDPWSESAHRQLMRIQALSGQRSAALVQYETCRQLLMEELGVEPARETRELYQQIKSGSLAKVERHQGNRFGSPIAKPAFLDEKQPPAERPLFVSREEELAQLQRLLALSLGGHGQMAFVTGEAGSGKSALLQEFSRQAQADHPEICIAGGNCNAYTGLGDPYLPFREILESLTGDVEASWAAGAISAEHARRLWHVLPDVVELIVEYGQGLINTFIPGVELLDRVAGYPDWPKKDYFLKKLERLAAGEPVEGSRRAAAHQRDLFQQFTKVLQGVAYDRPLLIVVDDLQWADLASTSLLFHLGRELAGQKIIIVGAYRPEEVALGRDGERHPLEAVVHEFLRDFGDIVVKLDQSPGHLFVDGLLDSEPNQLTVSFREKLTQHTRGHALFTIELLRDMQARGQLVKNPGGIWTDNPALEWERMPVRVEAAIAERFNRLAQPLREALQIASVEGEEFTAEIVAHVLGANEREIVRCLSSELDRQHRLVRPLVISRQGTQRVSRYRFRNYLFQKYLYENMDEIERSYLHEEVGLALEQLYGVRAKEIAVQLAWHYQEAGMAEKAVEYLIQACERALRLSAFKEAIAHLNLGFQLLPDSEKKIEQELALQLAMGIALQSTDGVRSPKVIRTYSRARELCILTGNTKQLCEVLGQIAVHHYVGAEYRHGCELVQEALSLAKQVEDPLLETLCYWYLGFLSFAQGEFKAAAGYLTNVITFYKPESHHRSFIIHGGKDAGLGALAYHACCLWFLGYPEQAKMRSQQAIALARELNHPFTLADTLCFAGCLLNQLFPDAKALKKDSEELIQLASDKVPGWLGTGNCYHGIALSMMGEYEAGIAEITDGLSIEQAKDIWCCFSGMHSVLALGQAEVGQPETALAMLDATFQRVEMSGEHYFEPELHRVRAEILLMQDQEAEAERSLRKGIEIARSQAAKSWELRGSLTLARLWSKQGKKDAAYNLLHPIYTWFSEGFDTRDLIEARQLLADLKEPD